MRLAVSNIAWNMDDTARAFPMLRELGVHGVEVAPSRIAEWHDLNETILRDYRRRVEGAGLAVSSLQAILFGKPTALLLGDDNGFRIMLDHMSYVADIAEILGARALVLGAARNRSRGGRTEDDALELGRERLISWVRRFRIVRWSSALSRSLRSMAVTF